MPNYLDVIEANKFWTAPESDIFLLPIVAIALGIGRNKMGKIPAARIMIEKRAYYRKSDILNWAIAEQVKGSDNLLLKLRKENSLISKIEKNRSKFYDYYLSKPYKSLYRPSSINGETKKDIFYRLRKEWLNNGGFLSKLNNCNNIEELKVLIEIAVSYREQFIKLRMGLPRGIELNRWWFIKDFDALLNAKLIEQRQEILDQINYNQTILDHENFIDCFDFNDVDFDISKKKLEISKLIVELRSELKELG